MNERTKTGLEILEAAVLLGILGDVMLRETPWGLNVLLFIGALATAMIMLVVRRKPELWSRQTLVLNGALIFFAACFAWRDSAELKVFDTLAVLTILAVSILPSLKIKIPLAGVSHYLLGFVWSSINAGIAPFFLVFSDVEWKKMPQTGWKKHLVSVLRGLMIAAPILVVFGALFVAADAVYQGIIERTFNIQPDVVVAHIFFVGFFSWITAGYLRGSLIENFTKSVALNSPDKTVKAPDLSITEIKDDETAKAKDEPQEEKKNWDWSNFDNTILPKFFTLGVIEISVVLGLINLLFLSFVIVQIPYLFGGFELVQNTPDFKLAEYARRGFGELVTVAALVLPILLASHWLLRKDSPVNEKIYRVLAGMQLVLLFVIMASAAQRLFLLTGNLGYGLTTIRFYPMVCMIWLALVFGWFALTVLRGARQQFAWGALWSAMIVLAALHVINPDAYIVRTNVRLMNEGRAFDAIYNSNLSDDAAPVLLDAMPSMSAEQRCRVQSKLSHRFEEVQKEKDFRTWNWSRSKARNAISQNIESFNFSNCAPETLYRDYSERDDF